MFRRTRHPIRRLGRFPPLMNVSVGYCPIQKTGSTTWSSIFKNIRGTMKRRGLREMKAGKAKNDVVFVFVREPYSRLLSAYVDKLFSPNTLFWGMTGKHIIRMFRKNASETSLRCGHDVTFPEFIRYVIHAQTTGEHRDGHFIPTHDHCSMCKIPYTHVGHLETLGEDMPYLLRVSQTAYNYTQNYNNNTLSDNAGWVLKAMRKGVSKCMSMKEACLRLWKKWHIRGIISKREPVPITADEAENITKEEFVKLGEAALERSGPKEQQKLQKTAALREAFASVPLEDRLEIQKLLFLDFALFGFDPHPESVFPSGPVQTHDGYSYFDLGKD
ncbi:uncharacterized protein [Littorina saxatilis]|uniref:uncharacterized protein n=1 Tax=Littorina saxatilis TaxID=31220 RepID=UPI0038B44D75